MADYFSPTVVRPTIPLADMTALEHLLLTHIFDAEPDGDALYLYEEQSIGDMLWLDADALREALAESEGIDSVAATLVTEVLQQVDAHDEEVELDLSLKSWEFLVQDIIRRSATLSHVVATSAFTCSKMRPDGFGGMVTVITGDAILSSSTEQMARELLDRAQYGELGCAPGFGSHIALRLDEAKVRSTVGEIFETDAPVGVTIENVSDADIRTACLAVLEQADLSHEHGELTFKAALAALHGAAERALAPP